MENQSCTNCKKFPECGIYTTYLEDVWSNLGPAEEIPAAEDLGLICKKHKLEFE